MKLAHLISFFSSSCLIQYGVAFIAPTSKSWSNRLQETILSMADDKTRVVVTGLGVISGCGIGHEAFFQACLDGTSSVKAISRFDASNYPCQIASEVPSDMFDPSHYFLNAKNVKSNDRFTHFAVAAARLALKDANIPDEPDKLPNPERIGVMVGSAFGGMETFEKETLKLAARPDRPKVSTNNFSPHVCLNASH
jgi:3-oxoacyl-[acyl-carrier-protein] synthase II